MTQFYRKKVTTESEEVIDNRFRHWMILLYPEWENFGEILQDIKGSFKNYAYIKHQPESGEKKEHYHLILSLDNPRSEKSLSKRLGIPSNLFQHVKSLRASNRYLIHMDNEEKIQYPLTDVVVSKSYTNEFFKSFDDLMSDSDILNNIYSFIEDFKEMGAIDLEIELTRFVCQKGFERVFKRYYNTISKVILAKTREFSQQLS